MRMGAGGQEMNGDVSDDRLLRRYLLGTLSPDSREAVEARLLSDDRVFWERLTLVEDDLIDDYVADGLDADDRAIFERDFLCTDARRSKLEFARAISAYADHEHGSRRLAAWERMRTAVLRPGWAMAAAALLLVLLPVAALRFGTSGPSEVSARLSPGLVRDAQGAVPRIAIAPDAALVRLYLEIGSDEYERYRATLHEASGDELWSQSRLSAADSGGTAVRVTLPGELLNPGDYYLRLYGVPPNQEPEPLGRYDVRVLRP